MPRPGDQITATIRLVRELGSGGMGSVWVADHGALQTQVVVKFMHVELAADRESVLRFSREAAAGANVKSPHVVQVLDHGIAPDGAPFIVMELLEGSDLAAHVEKNGPMPVGEVDHVISHACRALARAHERGIVHRDIKPQNIFLTNVGGGDPFVKVLDFGIAKASGTRTGMSSATKTGALMGTPYYMSPEQTVGARGVDHRTDLWALGVVAFECMTGQKPFEAETIGGLAVAICSGPMPVPSLVNSTLSADVDRWFARACARDPVRRFGSAKEMADALHMLVAGGSPGERFSNAPRTSLASTEPAAPPLPTGPVAADALPAEAELAPRLGITTRAPVSGESEDMSFLPKRRGRITLALAVVVVLIGTASVGLKLASSSPASPSAPSPPAAEPPPPPATPSPPASAALSPFPPVEPPAAPSYKAPPPVPATPRQDLPATMKPSPRNVPPTRSKDAPARPPAPGLRAPNCDPNYTLDANGEQHFKPECFAR